jgi:hypothetical protein
MIRREDVGTVRRLMGDHGYVQGLWDCETDSLTPYDLAEVAAEEAQHYELVAFLKRVRAEVPVATFLVPRSWRKQHLKCSVRPDGAVSFALFVDFHHNLDQAFDLEDAWRGVTRESLLGRSVPVQSLTGLVWFLAARLYHEAFQFNSAKLSTFGDLDAILTRRPSAVDWQELGRVAEKYGMQAPLYYVLAQLQDLTRAPVPSSILDRLRPDPLGLPLANDWGDILPKLLSRLTRFQAALTDGS